MIKILEAKYINGHFVLSEKLNPDLEGKTLKIMVFETDETEVTQQSESKTTKIHKFIEHVKKYSFKIPDDYKFNRDEIYER